jgi:hypothetical protein
MRLSAQSIQKVGGKDDDFILVIAGTAGSGKTSLGLHTYTAIAPGPRIEQIALTKSDFAIGLDRAANDTDFRYLQYDEGKLNRRDWQSDWSKELLEIYHDIRGLNIFHVWCTAMPELLDRVFVETRVKGFVFVYNKGDYVRRFLYFTKSDLLRFMDANDGKISMKVLAKFGKTFASLDSYFLRYEGALWKDYELKKTQRMLERVEDFKNRWMAEGWTEIAVTARDAAIGKKTCLVWIQEFLAAGELSAADIVVSGGGHSKISPLARQKIMDRAVAKRKSAEARLFSLDKE